MVWFYSTLLTPYSLLSPLIFSLFSMLGVGKTLDGVDGDSLVVDKYPFHERNNKMLLFAHLGLTLAAGWIIMLADLAFLALGSILPDVIDKLWIGGLRNTCHGQDSCPYTPILAGSSGIGRQIERHQDCISFDWRLRSSDFGLHVAITSHSNMASVWESPFSLRYRDP